MQAQKVGVRHWQSEAQEEGKAILHYVTDLTIATCNWWLNAMDDILLDLLRKHSMDMRSQDLHYISIQIFPPLSKPSNLSFHAMPRKNWCFDFLYSWPSCLQVSRDYSNRLVLGLVPGILDRISDLECPLCIKISPVYPYTPSLLIPNSPPVSEYTILEMEGCTEKIV